jgi:hypothetical protein
VAIGDLVMADLVMEVCNGAGAGPLALGGAVAGYRSFAGAVSGGAHFPYAIVGIAHPGEWETGVGSLDGEGRLVRSPGASSAGGAAVDFTAGEKRVALTPDAGWLNAVNGHGHAIGAISGLGSIAGAAASDYVPVTGGTMSGSLTFPQVPTPFSASFDGNIGFLMSAYGTGVVAAGTFHRARGSEAAPAGVALGDTLGGFRWRGQHAGGSTGTVGEFRLDVIEPVPSATAMGLRFAIYLPPLGSVARTAILTADHGDGLVLYQQMRPATDNSRSLGTAAYRWSVVYAGTGAINTSDARAKCDIGAVDAALLDAWGAVEWRRFRFGEAVAVKGEAARWHVGLIAQDVRDAIDGVLGEGAAVRWGLVCFDRWNARADEFDEEGMLVRAGCAAGDRWGLRYDECLALEAAWQRRRMDRLEARIAALEAGDAVG